MSSVKFCIYSLLLIIPIGSCGAFAADPLRDGIYKDGVALWKDQANFIKKAFEENNDAVAKKTWKSLDEKKESYDEEDIENIAKSYKTEDELKAYANWLRWSILVKNADPIYAYNYSYLMAKVFESTGNNKFKDQAMIFYVLAHLASDIDSIHCADKSARGIITKMRENRPSMRVVNNIKIKQTKSEMLGYVANAISIEEMRGARPPLPIYCRHGRQSVMQAVKLGRLPQTKVISEGPMKRSFSR